MTTLAVANCTKLLQEVLPIDEPIDTYTIRQHVADVAGDELFCFAAPAFTCFCTPCLCAAFEICPQIRRVRHGTTDVTWSASELPLPYK
jgi:hypothetical protein